MKIINSKKEVSELVDPILNQFNGREIDNFIQQIHKHILKKKIRFPLLEFAAEKIFMSIPEKHHIEITDHIMRLHEIGGNTIVGYILQLRLEKHFNESINKAKEYIILGDQWYVCDIIGERVMGYALLTQPQKTVPLLKKMTKEDDKWIVRCVGVATHYAVKKGLLKFHADEMFQLLLKNANTTEFHTKKGIGWAAKTISKFHPDITSKYKEKIDTDPEVKQWFRTKVKIGIGRANKYATRYSG